MPLYDYVCPDCGTVYEDVLVMKADKVHACECGTSCKKMIGAGHFKVNGHNAENNYSYKKTVIDNPPR